ncbi:MAG: glucokinase [Cyclobacteriaceae bacterium]|nr:MAG: glucokinase [Cyclobacteriaceae bacterium]
MYLGIDIGGTTTKLGLADSSGRFISENSFSTASYSSVSQFLSALDGEIIRMVSLVGDQLEGIGVGAPSANYRTGVIENAANLGWKGQLNIKGHLEEIMKCPVMVTNDANLPAIGEMTYGAAQVMENFVTISLGTGLGCGIVANGMLVGGHHGMAGELGHVNVKRDGRLCGCGRRGCLETYVSATGLKRTLFKLLADYNGGQSELEECTYESLSADQITEAALRGDQLAVETFKYTGKVLGRTLADLLLITDPEAIFLVGGMARAGDLLFGPTTAALNESKMTTYENKAEILPSSLPPEKVSILGACGLIQHLNQPKEKINRQLH